MLAELTHRCPLSCPYCSNPVEMARQEQELDTDTWARVFREAAALGVLQLHLSGGEPASRRDLETLVDGGPRGRALYQPDHLRHRTDRKAAGRSRCGGARSHPTVAAGHQSRNGRRDRRLQGRVPAQDAGGRMDWRDRLSADAERGAAPAQPAPAAAGTGNGGRNGCAADRGRNRPVPRLGAARTAMPSCRRASRRARPRGSSPRRASGCAARW